MSGRKTSLKDRSLIVAILLILAGGTAGEFLYFQGRARRPVYTDGLTTIHEGHLEAERIVLWEEPVGVFSETTTPDEESGPAMDGSGDVLLYAVGAPGTGTELWMAERVEGLTGGTWRRRRLHEVSSPADELCPFLSRDGRYLYFSSNRPGGHGGYDVYMAAREGKGFLPPLNLGPDVNSAGDDLDPTLSPTGDRLLFASDRKRPGREMLSLFSVDRIMGRWMKPRYLAAVSSSAVDRAPEIGPDGKTLFFASNRPGGSGGLDLYKSVFFNDVWLPPAPVTSLNTPRDETDPAVSAEGFTLLFSTSPGDLKMSHTRELFCWSADRDRALTLFGSLMLCLLILLLVIYLARRWAEMGILGRCVVTSLIVHAILFLYFNEVMVQGEVSLAGKQKGRYRISMLPGRARVLPGQRAFEKARGDQVKAVAQAAAPRVARAVADSPRPDSHRPGLADHGLATSRRVRPRPRMKPHRPKGPAPLQRPEADRLPRPDDPRRRRRRPLEHRERAAARVPHASPAAREPAPSPTPEDLARSAVAQPRHLLETENTARLGVREKPLLTRPEPVTLDPLHRPVPVGKHLALSGPALPERIERGGARAPVRREPARKVPPLLARSAPEGSTLDQSGAEPAPMTPPVPAVKSLVRKRPGKSPEPGGLVPPAPEEPDSPGRPLPAPLARAALREPEMRAPAIPRHRFQPRAPDSARPVPLHRKRVADPTPGPLEDHEDRPALDMPVKTGAGTMKVQPVTPLLAARGPELTAPSLGQPEKEAGPAGAFLLRNPDASPRTPRRDEEIQARVGTESSPAGEVLTPPMDPVNAPAALAQEKPPEAPRSPSILAPLAPPLAARLPLEEKRMPLPGEPISSRALVVKREPMPVPEVPDAVLSDREPIQTGPDPEAKNLASLPSAEVPAVKREPMPDVEEFQEPSDRILVAHALHVRPALSRPTEPSVPWVHRESSLYDHRSGEARLRALREYGGSAESERAVRKGLAYLARTQRSDGSWGNPRYTHHKYGQVQVGKTGLALLAFLGSGHTQKSSTRYSSAVTRAVGFLLRSQDEENGHFGKGAAYSHGIATYALAEAYAMTRDPDLFQPIKMAVGRILEAQVTDRRDPLKYGGWGYYYARPRIWDEWPRASVTAWQVMALKSAMIGGIRVATPALQAARTYLRRSFDREYGYFRYCHDPDRLRSAYRTLPGSTPASAFGLLLLGEKPDSERIKTGVRFVMRHMPRRYARASDDGFVLEAGGNLYFWYYSTLALFTLQTEDWNTWNSRLRDLLVKAQNADGSWTPISPYANYANDTRKDRGYTTALAVLMLEVYYRYVTPLLTHRPDAVELGEEDEDPFDLPLTTRRFRVVGLSESGIAFRAGIELGDEFYRYAGEAVHDLDQLRELIRLNRHRSRVKLEVYRKGRLKKFSLSGGPLGVTVEESRN